MGGGSSSAEVRSPVAEIFRRHGPAYLRDHTLVPGHAKALRALVACRTAALGGHLDVCLDCGVATPSYNSCRDRHCPNCQASAAKRWLDKQVARVLPTPYFHVVFTLPEPLRAVALANPKLVYDLLFSASSETLQELAASRLNAQLGITAVLHTWTRRMLLHPHLHCTASSPEAGSPSPGGQGRPNDPRRGSRVGRPSCSPARSWASSSAASSWMASSAHTRPANCTSLGPPPSCLTRSSSRRCATGSTRPTGSSSPKSPSEAPSK